MAPESAMQTRMLSSLCRFRQVWLEPHLNSRLTLLQPLGLGLFISPALDRTILSSMLPTKKWMLRTPHLYAAFTATLRFSSLIRISPLSQFKVELPLQNI